MKTVEFQRGQSVYQEGTSYIDGVYFITEGEFELTQKAIKHLRSPNNKHEPIYSHNRKIIANVNESKQNKSLKSVGLNSSRSQATLSKKDILSHIQQATKVHSLYIAGCNETFGLEEIIEGQSSRTMTVKCMTTTAKALFISTEYFVDCVNKFQFSEQILEE